MIAPLLLSSATDSPLLLGEEIEVRSTDKAVDTMKLMKKQIGHLFVKTFSER